MACHATPSRMQADHDQHVASLTSIPKELLDYIISLLDRESCLAVFRSCRQLRDGILFHTQDQQQHLQQPQQQHHNTQQQQQQQQQPGSRTRLFMYEGDGAVNIRRFGAPGQWPSQLQAPGATALTCGQQPAVLVQGLSGTQASRMLQLAARSQHDVHLHVQPASWLGVRPLQPWLQSVFAPWLATPPHAPSLQHLTTIWLQHMRLDHPLPGFIQQTCPKLKAYGLSTVYWPQPDGEQVEPWPTLQQLTLRHVSAPGLHKVFCPDTLPSLSSLSLQVEDSTWEKANMAGLCCVAFSRQLTSLVLRSAARPCRYVLEVMLLTRATRTTFPQLAHLHVGHLREREIMQLLNRAPMLVSLACSQLYMETDCSHESWGSLQQLHVREVQGDTLSMLAWLPSMPQLQAVKLGDSDSASVINLQLVDDESGWPRFAAEQQGKLCLLPSLVYLNFVNVACHDAAKKLELLLPLLQSCASVILIQGAITPDALRALGRAAIPCVEFLNVKWGQGVAEGIWSMLPKTDKLVLSTDISAAELQLICKQAMRPVTVQLARFPSTEFVSLKDGLAAAANPFVTLECV